LHNLSLAWVACSSDAISVDVTWLSAFERPAKPGGCGCLSAASSAAKLESTIKAKAQSTQASDEQATHAERFNKQKKATRRKPLVAFIQCRSTTMKPLLLWFRSLMRGRPRIMLLTTKVNVAASSVKKPEPKTSKNRKSNNVLNHRY
jgi:hypothetical protein